MGVMEQDPLAVFTAPPKGETPEDKITRERREQEAQRISDQIDQDLKVEKARLKKRQGMVKVLLLGQSESGMYLVLQYSFPSILCVFRKIYYPKKYVALLSVSPSN